MATAKSAALARKQKYEERAKYFNRRGGTDEWNNLTSEGRARSGVDFSYAGQHFHTKKVRGNKYDPHSKKNTLRFLGYKK